MWHGGQEGLLSCAGKLHCVPSQPCEALYGLGDLNQALPIRLCQLAPKNFKG